MPRNRLIFALGGLVGITSSIGALLNGNDPTASLMFGIAMFAVMTVVPD
jgi:hypothetical protein